MVILDPYGMTFDAVDVFGLDFQLLFKSGSSYCDLLTVLNLALQLKQKGFGILSNIHTVILEFISISNFAFQAF